MPHKRILIVEDEYITALDLKTQIMREGNIQEKISKKTGIQMHRYLFLVFMMMDIYRNSDSKKSQNFLVMCIRFSI
jgi:hypothetical protein